jgi:DNA (cytosine-5)-methyltransferase 1
LGKKKENINISFGSVCSGIEAAQLAFNQFGFKQTWSSEISEFPNKVLKHHHPEIPNLGDMTKIPQLILNKEVDAPKLFCGGTPCQAFSLAGWKNGLQDERGELTMKFIEIANAIDEVRKSENKDSSIIFWENVEGVLTNKTNPFGNFIAGLAGYDDEIKVKKWSKAGYIEGPKRNVAWRVLDAKYFGLPQQRKRLYVLAGDKEFRPDLVLFELDNKDIVSEQKVKQKIKKDKQQDLFSFATAEETKSVFYKGDVKFEVFRDYTDCLYAAYGTKWNGNAAAYNGSLYVAQNDRIRRFTPLECERLMGIPDNHTMVNGNSHTNRFQAVGNSWAVPVIEWIGKRIKEYEASNIQSNNWIKRLKNEPNNLNADLYLLGKVALLSSSLYLNTSDIPNKPQKGSLENIVEYENVPDKFYLSEKACAGILRRKEERSMNMNVKLEQLMMKNGVQHAI